MVAVAPKDYVGAIAAMLTLPAESNYRSDSKTFGEYESFTYRIM